MMDFDSHLSNAPSTCTQHGKGHLLESDRITDIGNFVELSIQEATQSVIILIYQVLNSYQTSDLAILIDDNNHMHTLLLYLAQEIIKLFGLRNKVSRAYQVPNRESIVALA